MLSTSPQKTEAVVCGDKPHIAHDCYDLYDEEFVEKLIDNISNASSVYHKTGDEWQAQIRKYEKKPASSNAEERVEPAPARSESPSKRRTKKKAVKVAEEDKEDTPEKEKKPKKEKESKKAKKESKKEEPEPVVNEQPMIDTTSNQQPAPNTGMDLDDLLGMGSATNQATA